MLPSEKPSGAPESCGDLIEYKIDSVFIAQSARLDKILRMIKPHASRALYHRLKNQRSYFICMLPKCLLKRLHCLRAPLLAESHRGRLDKKSDRERGSESSVHSCHRIAHRHCVPGIAMITASYRHKICLTV